MTETAPAPKSALLRTFLVLEAIASTEEGSTLSELSRATRLPHPTVHRLLGELVSLGMVERDCRSRYSVGTRLFEIGMQSPFQKHLSEAALPIMEDLYEVTHENVHVGILDGVSALIVQKIAGRGSVITAGGSGVRVPAHATANGKALLAFSGDAAVERVIATGLTPFTSRTITSPAALRREIAEIRHRGYAVAREECTYGTISLAAPVLVHDSSTIASLSIVFHTANPDVLKYASAIRVAAASVSRRWQVVRCTPAGAGPRADPLVGVAS